MCNACNFNAKSPFTKSMELVSNCSISFYMDMFIESATFTTLESNQ